jgi:glycosyltransferase involved in cell wall biosynthesis
MKILMVNSFYYFRGGAERYMFELTALLERHGHEVIPFSMVHKNNLPSKYSDFFIPYVDYPSLLKTKPNLPTMINAAERVIYSREAKQKIKQLILQTKPDIAHIHGIGHEMSPSVLDAIKSFRIPSVQTIHDFGLLCPNSSFLSHGEVCERCKGQRFYNVVLRRCKRDSLSASLLACISHYAHRLSHIYERNVDVFISPSRFMEKKFLEYGIDKKIIYIPNFINLDNSQIGISSSGYCIFAGRLVAIKGLWTLIEAAKINRQAKILIAGDGELEEEMHKVVLENHLDNVNLLGFVEPKELLRLMSSANFTIFPSEWYENSPMSIIESFACGKPVLASNIGALPDMVMDGWNGLLFEPGNAQHLASQIQYLFEHPEKAAEMGNHGREKVVTEMNPELHYQQIMQVYQQLLDTNTRTGTNKL